MLTSSPSAGYAGIAMKLWLKYMAGIVFGLAVFAVSPPELFAAKGLLSILAEISLRIGYFVFGALLCLNIPLAVLRLYEERKFWAVAGKNLGFFVCSLFAASLLGLLTALAALPVRVPLLAETEASALRFAGIDPLRFFPQSLAELFLVSGSVLAPAVLFALAIGAAMAHDPMAARPAATFFDSLSRILHTINIFITEIAGVFLIPLSAKAFHSIAQSSAGGVYWSFLLVLGIAALALFFVVIPLALFFLGGKKNPFPLYFSCLPAVVASLAAADLRFSSGIIIRQTRENLGVRRRYNAVVLPAGLFFGRAGTAFVTALALVIVLSSYSQLVISPLNLMLIVLIVPAATIAASASLQNGPIAALALGCALFGKGFENAYLVMIPISFFLSASAAFFDALWIGAAQALVAKTLIPQDRKESRYFI